MSSRQLGRVTKYDCDRCLKEFAESKALEKPDPLDSSVKRGASILAPLVREGEVSFQRKDLCGDCVTELSAWMEKK
jgi:hypothetical protein